MKTFKGNDNIGEKVTETQELADVPFHKLIKLKSEIGTKKLHVTPRSNIKIGRNETCPKPSFKRENKNRPREMSSKLSRSHLRNDFAAKVKETRDPRFDDQFGSYNQRLFKASYAFLDDIRVREKKELVEQLEVEKNPNVRGKIKSLIQGMNDREKQAMKVEEERKTARNWRQQQVQEIEKGNAPYFPKKSVKRKLELAAKYEALKKSGKLEAYLKKKRKKNAAKDRRKLPTC